jgi:hypothetical protein
MNDARRANPPPLPVEGFHIDTAWHDRRNDDPVSSTSPAR